MGPLQHFRRLLFGLFLAQYALAWVRLFLPLLHDARWPEGLLLILAAANLLLSLGRYLPLQNVCLATAIILFVSGLVVSFGVRTGIPFGPISYDDHFGTKLWGLLPWPAPVLWLVAALSARGASRFLLSRWRDKPNYGFWLIGLGVLLTVLFDAALEPFATHVKGYWSWAPGHQGVVWFGAPVLNFIGWVATALAILVLVTPALINKRPVPPPRDYQPLMIWALAVFLFMTGVLAHRFRGVAPVSGPGAQPASNVGNRTKMCHNSACERELSRLRGQCRGDRSLPGCPDAGGIRPVGGILRRRGQPAGSA